MLLIGYIVSWLYKLDVDLLPHPIWLLENLQGIIYTIEKFTCAEQPSFGSLEGRSHCSYKGIYRTLTFLNIPIF
jgi:hypothetical protein